MCIRDSLSAGLFYKNLNNFIYNYLDASYTTDKFEADFPDLPNPIPMDEQWRMVRPPVSYTHLDVYKRQVR